jgi:hypothetical protein
LEVVHDSISFARATPVIPKQTGRERPRVDDNNSQRDPTQSSP